MYGTLRMAHQKTEAQAEETWPDFIELLKHKFFLAKEIAYQLQTAHVAWYFDW